MFKVKDKESFLNGAAIACQIVMRFADTERTEIWETIDPYNALSDDFRKDIVARIVALLTAAVHDIDESPEENDIEFEGQ